MEALTSDLTGLLYQTDLIIVPFTNPLIRPESLSCPGALLGKQTRRQSGSLTSSNFQSNGKQFQSDLSHPADTTVPLACWVTSHAADWLLNLNLEEIKCTFAENGIKI